MGQYPDLDNMGQLQVCREYYEHFKCIMNYRLDELLTYSHIDMKQVQLINKGMGILT